MPPTPSQLLEQAAELYAAAKLNHRDAMLAVGRALQQFVIARLEEADATLPSQCRGKASRTRAIRDAAARLRTSPGQIRHVLASAAAVDLLSDGKPLGSLGFGAIRCFQRLVRRRSEGRRRVERSVLRGQYFIRACCREWAKGLFAQAVEEGWSQARVRRELATRIPERTAAPPADQPSKRKTQPKPLRSKANRPAVRPDKDAVAALCAIARVGSPRDVAEALLSVVKEASDPHAVLRYLTDMVAKIPKPRATLAG